jgi:hypothetical protein
MDLEQGVGEGSVVYGNDQGEERGKLEEMSMERAVNRTLEAYGHDYLF